MTVVSIGVTRTTGSDMTKTFSIRLPLASLSLTSSAEELR
jgi:hypothetical protein